MGILSRVYEFRWAIVLAGVGYYIARKFRTYFRLRALAARDSSGYGTRGRFLAGSRMSSPLARIGPCDLVTSDPQLWAHMSSVRSPYSRAPWYFQVTRFQPGQDHVFSELDEEKHMKRRQQLAAGYSGKENHGLEASIDVHIVELLDLIRTKYLSTEARAKPFDFTQKITYFTLDVISRIGFGEPFGDLRADGDVDEFIEAIAVGLSLVSHVMALGLTGIVSTPWVSRNFGPSEKDKTGLGRVVAKARKFVEARLEQDSDTSKKSDMLGAFMRHGLDKEEVITEACLQIIAGSDTTSTALRGTMLYILSHPRVYAKLQREVDDAVKSGAVAPAPGVIADAEAREMAYLQAVIREGIRIHPPVTDEAPKRVPDGGDTVTVDGKEVFLPGGTYVGIATLAMYRRKDLFGDDVEEFRPERWLLEEDEGKLTAMNRASEMVFGYGKYQCLGKPIALMEIGKVLFELMRHFDWCLASPEKPWKEHNWTGIFTHEDFWVLASEREKTT